jgi:hypothetical protein
VLDILDLVADVDVVEAIDSDSLLIENSPLREEPPEEPEPPEQKEQLVEREVSEEELDRTYDPDQHEMLPGPEHRSQLDSSKDVKYDFGLPPLSSMCELQQRMLVPPADSFRATRRRRKAQMCVMHSAVDATLLAKCEKVVARITAAQAAQQQQARAAHAAQHAAAQAAAQRQATPAQLLQKQRLANGGSGSASGVTPKTKAKAKPKAKAKASARGTVPANAAQQAALYAKQQAQLAKMTPQQQAAHAAQQAKIQQHTNALLRQFQALQNDTSVRAIAFPSYLSLPLPPSPPPCVHPLGGCGRSKARAPERNTSNKPELCEKATSGTAAN